MTDDDDSSRFLMDASDLSDALSDGIITMDEAVSVTSDPQDGPAGYEPLEIEVSQQDFRLIVPVDPTKTDSKMTYNPAEYCNYFLTIGILCDVHDKHRQWFAFDGRIYAPIDEAEIKAVIYGTANVTDDKGFITQIMVTPSRAKVQDLMEYLASSLSGRLEDMELDADGIAPEYSTSDGSVNVVFLNGVLHGHLDAGGMRSLLPFTMAMPFRHCLRADYRPLDALCPVADKWFDMMLPDTDTRRFVMEMVGYILYHRNMSELPALFILFGPGGTGKSTLAKMIANILGPESYSKLGLTDLANEFTRASQMAGKLLNICEEASDQSRREIGLDIGLLKRLSDGDIIPINNKGVKAYSARNTAKLLFTTNVRPDFGSDDGIVRRLYRVPFLNKILIPADDYRVLMSKEGNTWLAMRALEAYGDLLGSKEYSRTKTISFHVSREMQVAKVEQILDQMEAAHLKKLIGTLDYEAVRKFLTTDGLYMSRSALYNSYCDYCKDRGIKESQIKMMNKYLPDICHQFGLGKTKKRREGWASPRYVFTLDGDSGIQDVDLDTDDEPQPIVKEDDIW